MADFTREELAHAAGVSTDLVDRLVELQILTAKDGEKPFTKGDLYRSRLVLACEEAGLGLEAIGKAIAAGKLSLSFMDLPHYRWAALSDKTYRQVAEELDVDLEFGLEVVQALGYVRPNPDDFVREDEFEISSLIKAASTVLDKDAILRTARVYVDSLRRVAEAEATLFDTYFVQAFEKQGLEWVQAVDLANRFGADFAPLQEAFILATYRRQQEKAWTEYTVESIETKLEELGLYDKPDRPPAFGFVDLAGYTRLTEEHGDLAGARLAADLTEMVDDVARGHRGQPVKWLGDGVMVFFREPSAAVQATVEMVKTAPEVGLPAHAGVAAGPVVFQDGDYYGRTVNMAARIASHATSGQTLVSDETAEIASKTGLRFREIGPVELKGFTRPVKVFEVLT